jgi:hypothetical protein
VLGPDGLGFVAVSVQKNNEKFVSLATGFQQKFPVSFFEIQVSDYSETALSSSSNLTLTLSTKLNTTTTTKEPVSDYSETENHENTTDQVKRILEATTILFGEPGVFTKGLHLESIYPEVALGWIKQGLNAKNLELCKRAGVVYNGLKSGEKPKSKFLYDGDDSLPLDFRVAIGHAQKTCDLCGDKFSSLDEFDAHWKICVVTPKEDPEHDVNLFDEFVKNPILDEKRADGRMSINDVWESLLNQLQLEMPRASFDTWARDTKPYSWVEDKKALQIAARNSYACDWLKERLTQTVERLLSNLVGEASSVEFVVVT